MLLSDVSDFEYSPPDTDLSHFLHVVETENGDGSVTTAYNLNEGVVVNGVESLPDSAKTAYTVKRGDSLKLISYRTYGTIDYWWLIAKVNGISDVLEGLEVGSTIYLLDVGTMKLIYSYILEGR